ncbi:hypothetical protein [Lysinibacillus fusiformis]
MKVRLTDGQVGRKQEIHSK